MIECSEAYQDAIVADGRRMYVKAVVDIEDPDMVQGGTAASEQEPEISRPEQVWDKDFVLSASYAALELNRLILDGKTQLRPADAATREWEAGLVGAALSGEDGVFPAPQWVQIDFSGVGVLQACAVAFSDRPADGVAADFTVEVLSEGVAYHTKAVTGNTQAVVSVTGFRVNNPDAIRVTVTRWSLPGRRMRVAEIVPGVYEVWTGDSLEKSGVSVKMQADPSCQTIPYGTATIKMDNESRRFDPRTKDGIFLMLEDRQGVELHMGPLLPDGTVEYKPLGVYYQANGGWKTGDNDITMQWSLVDIIGLIAQRTFTWEEGTPLPTTLRGWLEALAGQLGESFKARVQVAPDYADLPVSIPYETAVELTCGDILRYVCMATGTWPRAGQSTGYLTAEPLRNEGNKLTLDNLTKYPTMSASDDTASVTVNGYTAQGNAPACGNTVEISNPFIKDNVAAARSLLTWYGGDKIETTGRGDPASEIGDMDVIWLAEGNATSARRIKQTLTISGGVLRNCTSSFVRGAGMYQFSRREQFLESGTFVVPEGVWQLRVVLVGHGGSGSAGGNGKYNNNRNQWMGKFDYPQIAPPTDGKPGQGGAVWEGVIDVNPGQVIQITVAGSTTLWQYSSSDGQHYPNGFTDVADGAVYGRSGVGSPRPGSGDGGSGGRAGSNGSWYERGIWVQDDGKVFVHPELYPDETGPGHWEHEVVIEREPTDGSAGSAGASGCAIIYWEPPEVIDE